MNYLDANFVTALHFPIRGQSEFAQRFVRRTSAILLLSSLAEVECRRAFLIRSGMAKSTQWTRLQAVIDSGGFQRDAADWKQLAGKTCEIIDLHCREIPSGTLDTMHVAHAILSGCSAFLSFDTKSHARILAARCHLKPVPELSPAEKSRLYRCSDSRPS